MDIFLFLDIVGTCIGLVYLWLEYNAKRSLWIVSMIMPAIDIFSVLRKRLVCGFRNGDLLFADSHLRMDSVELWTNKAATSREPEKGIPSHRQDSHMANTAPHTRLCGDLGTALFRSHKDQLYRPRSRQYGQRALHRCHVDAGTQIHRTVARVVRGRCYPLRSVYLQRRSLSWHTLWLLHHRSYFGLSKVAANAKTLKPLAALHLKLKSQYA